MVADRQTHANTHRDRQTDAHHNTPFRYRGRRNKQTTQFYRQCFNIATVLIIVRMSVRRRIKSTIIRLLFDYYSIIRLFVQFSRDTCVIARMYFIIKQTVPLSQPWAQPGTCYIRELGRLASARARHNTRISSVHAMRPNNG